VIWLEAAALKRLVDLAESAYPDEACALLVGRRLLGDHYRVSRVEPARNVAPDPRRRFEVDRGLRIGLERELRGKPQQVIGAWHSHPDGPAAPSAVDAARIYEPELVWLITAVSGGQALQSAAFLPARGGGFRPLPLAISSEGSESA
jgi:proteasome lid subunit RPN8/RPN11